MLQYLQYCIFALFSSIELILVINFANEFMKCFLYYCVLFSILFIAYIMTANNIYAYILMKRSLRYLIHRIDISI